jgi:hypothetical protein
VVHHPVTGRQILILFVNPMHVHGFEGMRPPGILTPIGAPPRKLRDAGVTPGAEACPARTGFSRIASSRR